MMQINDRLQELITLTDGHTINAIFGVDDMVLAAVYIAILVISTVISLLLQPKPPAGPSPQEINSVPTADPARYLPVLFGTRTISTANVIWYGDKSTIPHQTETGKK